MKKIVLLLLGCLIIGGFASCRKCEVIGRKIVGTWTKSAGDGTVTLTFEKHGQMTITSGYSTTEAFYSFETHGKNKFRDVHLFISNRDNNCFDSYVPNIKHDVLVLEAEGVPCPHVFVAGSYNRVK